MFSLHFNLCNPAINNRGVSVGKWKLFARSREDIADIRNYHAGNYCIPVFTSCILMQRNFFPEIFFEFSLGHAVKPVTAHLTTFIIISMFIRVITKKIQIFTKEQEFTANPNQNLPSRHVVDSRNYIFISLKLFVKNILISSKSSLNASMTSGQHSQSLRLGRNYRISFCLLNIFKKRNSSQRPKTGMQNTA